MKIRAKRLFAGFETRFVAFAVLLLEQYNLFYVNRGYFCQDTGENLHSPDLKMVLRHSPCFFIFWRLFFSNRRYHCQDTGENVYFSFLTPVLRYSPFYF